MENASTSEAAGKYPLSLDGLEEAIGYVFHNRELAVTALTHSSYANELHAKGQNNVECYERLEFLGDSVLSIIASDYLFSHFRKQKEGDLTKIRAAAVCEGALYEYSRSLSIGDYMYIGHGEELMGGRSRRSILADMFEALLAAIYLDGGFGCAKKFALPFLVDKIDELTRQGGGDDCKTLLQQFIQQNHGDILEYNLLREEGPPHARSFFYEVCLNNNCIGHGSGSTKREAEQMAAREALILFGVIPEEKNKTDE